MVAMLMAASAGCTDDRDGGGTPGADNDGTTTPPAAFASSDTGVFLNIRPTADKLECAYVPNGAPGGDGLTIFYSLLADSAYQLDRLVPIRATSDTGLVSNSNSGVGSGVQAIVQFALRATDFGRTHRILISTDPDNVIAETNDLDNQITVVVSIPAPRPATTIDPLPCSPG
jgi:hypothetical protein